jgi:hypothetical protein
MVGMMFMRLDVVQGRIEERNADAADEKTHCAWLVGSATEVAEPFRRW